MTANSLEDRLEQIGEMLRQRPSVTRQVVDELRRVGTPQRALRRRVWPMVVSVAALAAAILVTISLMPAASKTWADVVAAVDSKPWVHARAADGSAEMWQGSRPPCWAFKARDRVMYWDQTERAKYEFRSGQNTMSKYPLAAGELDRILLIENSAGGEPRVGPWLFGTERIVSQSQREVVENGRRWLEFQLLLARGAARQATLRVDPQTMLPESLACRVSEDKPPTSVWVFDYPDDGPQDVYALGVPRGVKVDAHLLAADAQRVLDGMAASRNKFGNFHAIVATESNRYALPTYVLWRKQDRWRIDTTSPGDIAGVPATLPEGQNWNDWWKERLERSRIGRWYVCDARTVYRNAGDPNTQQVAWTPTESIAPPALMSGDRSSGLPDWVRIPHLVYPDLTPQPGWGFEFEPQAADAPGCALLKISANIATVEPMKAHEWYWIDPAKGFAVVRCERFNLPADVVPGPDQFAMGQSLRMEQFRQTPAGAWYPEIVRESSAMLSEKIGGPVNPAQRVEGSVRYFFDFDAELPDTLFEAAPSK